MIKEEITELSNKVNLKINKDFYKKNNYNNEIFLAYLYHFLLKHNIYKLFININKIHNIKFVHNNNNLQNNQNEHFIIKFKKNTKKVNTQFILNFSIPKNHFYDQQNVLLNLFNSNKASNLISNLPKDIFNIIFELINNEINTDTIDSKLEKKFKKHKNRDKFIKNYKINDKNLIKNPKNKKMKNIKQ
jgi:hypothetical protein